MEITVARVGQPLRHHEQCFDKHCQVMGRGIREIDAALVSISSNLACISFHLARLSSNMEIIKEELAGMRQEIRAMRREVLLGGAGIIGFLSSLIIASSFVG